MRHGSRPAANVKSVKEALKTDPPQPPVFSAIDLKRLEDAFPVEIYRPREEGL